MIACPKQISHDDLGCLVRLEHIDPSTGEGVYACTLWTEGVLYCVTFKTLGWTPDLDGLQQLLFKAPHLFTPV
ncbi:MAG: hypothetical protein ACREIA_24505 [Opitutaceae bacterium]